MTMYFDTDDFNRQLTSYVQPIEENAADFTCGIKTIPARIKGNVLRFISQMRPKTILGVFGIIILLLLYGTMLPFLFVISAIRDEDGDPGWLMCTICISLYICAAIIWIPILVL
jgi:hypothetical protein